VNFFFKPGFEPGFRFDCRFFAAFVCHKHKIGRMIRRATQDRPSAATDAAMMQCTEQARRHACKATQIFEQKNSRR